jgi:hypothetical protein
MYPQNKTIAHLFPYIIFIIYIFNICFIHPEIYTPGTALGAVGSGIKGKSLEYNKEQELE